MNNNLKNHRQHMAVQTVVSSGVVGREHGATPLFPHFHCFTLIQEFPHFPRHPLLLILEL